MLGDHGINELDDRLLILGFESFHGLKAPKQPGVAQRHLLDGVAGEQVIHGRAQGIGQLDEHLGGWKIKSALVLVELLEADSHFSKNRRHPSTEHQYYYNANNRLIGFDGQPVGMQYNNRLYFIHSDHLGTPRAITDNWNTLVWRWRSKPFGDSPPEQDPDGDGQSITFNLRFPGQYFDEETGFYYNYFRYYDPSIGRYLTADPIGLAGGINLYTYALDNPVRYTDPFGLSALTGTLPIAGGLAAADGPLPVGDLIGLGLLGGALLYDLLNDSDDTADDGKQCDDDKDDCEEEIRECTKLCKKAQYDPDMKNVWGGSWAQCMLGCVSWRCMDQLPDR